jgi:Flp pilus assembly protein CpaB
MVEVIETADSLFAPENERLGAIEDVVGRVTSKGIPEHTPILKSMLAEKGTAAGLIGRIPHGFRAVSVKIDEVTGVAFQLKPGDWVDVIVVMDVATSQRGRKETIAEVLLQHVQVAAIGHTTSGHQNPSESKVKPAKSATILVTEEDVPKLHLAGTRGKITLAMRGADDETKSPTHSANLTDILEQITGTSGVDKNANGQAPVKPIRFRQEEELPHSVLVFHGNIGNAKSRSTVEQITFESKDSPKIVGVSTGMPSRSAMDSKEGPTDRRTNKSGWGGSNNPFNNGGGSDENRNDS